MPAVAEVCALRNARGMLGVIGQHLIQQVLASINDPTCKVVPLRPQTGEGNK